MLLSHVCHSWRHYVGISWSCVELVGSDLPRQLSWIRKQPCQDILQVREAGMACRISHSSVLLPQSCPARSHVPLQEVSA